MPLSYTLWLCKVKIQNSKKIKDKSNNFVKIVKERLGLSNGGGCGISSYPD
jgi:hypothetical protein